MKKAPGGATPEAQVPKGKILINTECTASAPETAAPGLDDGTQDRPTPAERPARTKVNHLYWVSDLELARGLGMAVVSLCGKKTAKPMPKSRQGNVGVVGGLVPLLKERDCLLCGRVLSANYQRRDRERGL